MKAWNSDFIKVRLALKFFCRSGAAKRAYIYALGMTAHADTAAMPGILETLKEIAGSQDQVEVRCAAYEAVGLLASNSHTRSSEQVHSILRTFPGFNVTMMLF